MESQGGLMTVFFVPVLKCNVNLVTRREEILINDTTETEL
jgi:hypothetical protein